LVELIKTGLRRAKAPLEVGAIVKLDKPHKHFLHGNSLKTSRTQLEMKIGGCLCDGHGKTDILLLKVPGPVKLTCHLHGPADVIADIDASDVDVAIEIKACPSSMSGQRKKCRADVAKLHRLVEAHPRINAYFLFLDKSVSIPKLAAVSSPKHKDWLEDMNNKVRGKRPTRRPFVEIWDLDTDVLVPRRRFYG
jgi:hypothetical protein